MALTLRHYRSSDLAAVYDICLRTGNAGEDAQGLYRDPWALGHRYAGPYVALGPEFTFVVDNGARAVGYIVGTPDSRAFAEQSERQWFELLRPLYPLLPAADQSRDAAARRLIHAGYTAPAQPWALTHPAHLHIDLLPEAQGQGWGRALMERFWEALRGAGVPGVHLGVGNANPKAQAFYRRLGYQQLEDQGNFFTLGYNLR